MSLSSTASLVKTSRNTPTESKQIIESTIWVGSVLEAILMIARFELLRYSTLVNAYFGPHGRLPNQVGNHKKLIEYQKSQIPHVVYSRALQKKEVTSGLQLAREWESYHPLINYLKIQKDLTAGFSIMPDDPAKENLRRCFSDPSLQT
ncbi:hypothetical protein PGTUg99_015558 [Puccinia graminis f. sp. tritici]|uniref:Uncharacterized protein n=1 Tax=Puccinia graminis f. sp. tritici TaxID=56615 RepID=A0A5B0RUU6_PUCGR|nr:hypothetical protein PGTUg99_015558 [Puccinia graminis f. sp. tritici]